MKTTLSIILLGLSLTSYSQLNWRKNGNDATPGAQPPTMGTDATWNSQLGFITFGQHRMRINPNLTTTVSGVNKPFDGFVGISTSGYFSTNTPLTMLHLYGKNNAPGFGAGGGWRQWMETGLLSNENSDGMYVGMKQEGTNRSDAIINWSDDVNLKN